MTTFQTLIFISSLIDMAMFIATIIMNASKKSGMLVGLYLFQSVALSLFMLLSALEEKDSFLLFAAGVTFFVKAVIAPTFFFRLIKKYNLNFASETYLNTPMTLAVIFGISIFSYAAVSAPGTVHSFGAYSAGLGYAPLHLAGILVALLLTVNRKDALSQIVGVLALENWVVFIATLSGLRQPFVLELAVAFDIIVWIVIAVAFVAMLERHFGSVNISRMTHLAESEK